MRRELHTGFTLLEMIVVMTIIATVAAVALPRFASTIAFAGHEGAASRLTNYGRAALDHAALTGETLVLSIDTKAGRYWTERELLPETESEIAPSYMTEIPSRYTANDWDDAKIASMELTAANSERHDTRLRQRADRIDYDREGLLQGRGVLFQDDFALKEDARELGAPTTTLLDTVDLPSDVQFESVQYGDKTFASDIAEIRIGPAGLDATVRFVLAANDRTRTEVVWDAARQSTYFRQAEAEQQ